MYSELGRAWAKGDWRKPLDSFGGTCFGRITANIAERLRFYEVTPGSCKIGYDLDDICDNLVQEQAEKKSRYA